MSFPNKQTLELFSKSILDNNLPLLIVRFVTSIYEFVVAIILAFCDVVLPLLTVELTVLYGATL